MCVFKYLRTYITADGMLDEEVAYREWSKIFGGVKGMLIDKRFCM